jgi:aryl-alcohol dehydrogenase-like predicted oxidoreductase
MEYRAYGRTALSCSAIGFGTWKVFNVTSSKDKSTCRRVVDEAFSGGSNLFDSSPMYGHSEHVLAECLMGRRDKAIVATKVWANTVEEARRQIRDALTFYEGRIDLYQVHNLSLTREVLGLFDGLRAEGKVRAVGATHYQPPAFSELMTWMESGRLDGIQVPYSVGERTVEREVLPLAAKRGLGVLVMLPLQQGKLVARAPPAEALKPFEKFGCTTWPQVLLKWVLSDKRVTAAIPATRDPAHARENLAAGSPPWFDDDARAMVVALAKERS